MHSKPHGNVVHHGVELLLRTNYTYWCPGKYFSSLAGAKSVPPVLADMDPRSCMVVATTCIYVRISTPTTLALPGHRGVAVVGAPEQGSLPKAGFPASA